MLLFCSVNYPISTQNALWYSTKLIAYCSISFAYCSIKTCNKIWGPFYINSVAGCYIMFTLVTALEKTTSQGNL